MNREIDERVFWCKTRDGEIKPYQLPPVGRGLLKGATDFPLIYPAIRVIAVYHTSNVVRAICAIPKRREYDAYAGKIIRNVLGKVSAELERDFMQCLREVFTTYAKLGFLGYSDGTIAVRELQAMLGYLTCYNQKRVKSLLKILREC